VISMPNLKSIAVGVSHFITNLPEVPASIFRQGLARPNPQHHEFDLMIFMRPARSSTPP
jgi:hypothetical protein